jgi:GNAT superfamily N-acetyltransferase
MIKEKEVALLAHHDSPLHSHADANIATTKKIETNAGNIILHRYCQPSLIMNLRADSGLRAFARRPQREHELLLNIARLPDSALTLAYTPTGEIVGQVSIVPCELWYQGLKHIYEIAIEVSSGWRRLGLAQELLKYALEFDALEDIILLAIGLSWHWDTEGMRMPPLRYRKLIARVFESHGFLEYQTTEPDIASDPANILLARIGSRVDQQAVGQFINRLLVLPDMLRY